MSNERHREIAVEIASRLDDAPGNLVDNARRIADFLAGPASKITAGKITAGTITAGTITAAAGGATAISVHSIQSPQLFRSDIVLGKTYRDRATGLTGTATAVHFYEHGPERVTLRYLADGQLHDAYIDGPDLVLPPTTSPATGEETGA